MEAVATDDEHEHPQRQAEFRAFFEQHHRELSRFAYLLTGDHDAADDITADALTAAWTHWDRVHSADLPLAYVRRIVANLAADRVRKVVRERRGLLVLGQRAERAAPVPDVPAVVDLRTALMALPPGKRACVVLRYAFDQSEGEVARTLGISVGTVKSQTARGVAELERILRGDVLPPARAASKEVNADVSDNRGAARHAGVVRSADGRHASQPLTTDGSREPGQPATPGLTTFVRPRSTGRHSATRADVRDTRTGPPHTETSQLSADARQPHADAPPAAASGHASADLTGRSMGVRGRGEQRSWPLWRVGEI